MLLKPLKFRVIKSVLDVERQWQIGEDILLECFVVVLHIEIQSLLVVHVKVVLNLVVQLLLREPRGRNVSKSWSTPPFWALLFRILLNGVLFLFVRFVLWSC